MVLLRDALGDGIDVWLAVSLVVAVTDPDVLFADDGDVVGVTVAVFVPDGVPVDLAVDVAVDEPDAVPDGVGVADEEADGLAVPDCDGEVEGLESADAVVLDVALGD